MKKVELYSVDSTNAWAMRNCAYFDPAGITCISAEIQTDGKGRQQRAWVSPPNNLYVTYYFTLPANTEHLSKLAQLGAFAVGDELIEQGLLPKIKLPNDVQLGGRKVCGVLCETQFRGALVDLFLGIGINVNMEKEMLETIDQPATSLFVETHHHWDRSKLLEALSQRIVQAVEKLKK